MHCPNQYFNAHVCPELVGRFTLDDARDAFNELNQPDRISAIQQELTALSHLSSPLDDMVKAILASN